VLGTLAVLCALTWGAWQLSKSRQHQLVGTLLTRVATSDSLVALTFDDGPGAIYTDSVLDLLDRLNVKATFFMVGSSIAHHPDVAARVHQHGHELGNHSYTHARLVLKSPGRIRHEVETTDSLIRAAGQSSEPFMRPPYGKRLVGLPWYLARRGRPVILWSLEPDSYRADADGIVRYVLERATPGAIILLHVEMPGRAAGRAAVPGIVKGLRAQGYRFVTLTELVGASGVTASALTGGSS